MPSRKRKRSQSTSEIPNPKKKVPEPPAMGSRKRKRSSKREIKREEKNKIVVLDEYGRFQTLEEVILSLLPEDAPPSPAECLSCGGATCLICFGSHHLLRDSDPPEYRNLVTASYCFLPWTAPQPPTTFHRVGWDQKQLVWSVMEEFPRGENSLSAGYEEQHGFSSAGEVLCTYAWDLLLERIGDHLMVFLLGYSSVFVFLKDRIYRQLTGSLLSEVIEGHSVEQKAADYAEKHVKFFSGGGIDGLRNTLNQVQRKRKQMFSWQHHRMDGKITSQTMKEVVIDRRRICFSTSPFYSTFPIGHILLRTNPDNSGADLLMKEIFGFSKEDFQLYTGHDEYCSLVRLLESLITNARNCNLKNLLHKHLRSCPFPTCEQCKKIDYRSKVTDLTEFCCSHHEVVLFIWAVIRHIVPIELLGNYSNWRALMSYISKFVGLQRFEKFYSSHTSQHPFLTQLSSWLFSSIVVPIIRSCFYVTEIQYAKQQVFYFPRPLWRKLACDAVSGLKEHKYTLLDREMCMSIIKKRKFGYSSVRFLPKKNTMRILTNTKTPCKIDGSYNFFVKSVKSSLQELHMVLKRIKYETPEALGCSVFGYNEVYQKLHQFLCKIQGDRLKKSKVFIVVGDVEKAFDSINQDKLIQIIEDLIIEANIRLQSSPCVTNDQGESKRIKKELQHLLIEHLKHNILEIDQKLYVQNIGIGQGCSISPLLCSIYFGHLENDIILPDLRKEAARKIMSPNNVSYRKQRRHDLYHSGSTVISNSEGEHWSDTDNAIRHCSFGTPGNFLTPSFLLLRWIDDFLLISTFKDGATRFLSRMKRGFSEYNCYMNNNKFCTSFDVGQNNHTESKLYTGADGVQFIPWCGLLFNCDTLEIQSDYRRYLRIPIRSTLTVDANDNRLSTLEHKLHNYVQPKCHPLFYDSRINSQKVVCLNAYQAFLLCAMKFHCYLCSISDNTQLSPSSLFSAIERSFRFMYKLINKQMDTMGEKVGITPFLKLKRKEMFQLGLYAYIWVLEKKHVRYRELLSLLRVKISSNGRMGDVPDSIKYAIDECHSSVFKEIQFYKELQSYLQTV